MHFQQEEGSLSFLPHSVNRRKCCEEGETPSDGRFALPLVQAQGCSLARQTISAHSEQRLHLYSRLCLHS